MARPPKDDAPRPPVVDIAWRDVAVPQTEEQLQMAISRGVARALELACTAKDLTEAVKAASAWYETLYGANEDDDTGTGLVKQGANGDGRG